MKVRDKKTGEVYDASRFNTHSLNEIIVLGNDWMDTMFMEDYDVLIRTGWKDLKQAFKDSNVITDNYNTYFFEAPI